ncbi:hypothetical protein [Agriterribacter sp.]|uniref:hypothetical protein n=1 Tax=Agriterribacter sp. TaxID=2821509 RepID=UPI002B8BD458|nr:hypothetical protein [Agriterribacter sp.]HTN09213.1 hypothetical protein [Agriterribacter sp.]
MKTILPESINTIQQAKALLIDLHHNGEAYHPEDNADEIIWQTCQPSQQEKDRLNKLMADMHGIKSPKGKTTVSFDPCEFLISLDHENVKRSGFSTVIHEEQYKGLRIQINDNGTHLTALAYSARNEPKTAAFASMLDARIHGKPLLSTCIDKIKSKIDSIVE